jgi:hypothetical protein
MYAYAGMRLLNIIATSVNFQILDVLMPVATVDVFTVSEVNTPNQKTP